MSICADYARHGLEEFLYTAVALANQNLAINFNDRNRHDVLFKVADIFQDLRQKTLVGTQRWDILVSNPPYISQDGFNRETARSVRNWEPRAALLPSYQRGVKADDGDTYYPRLLQIATEIGAKVVVLEVGGIVQAKRVVSMVLNGRNWKSCEIWRDWPEQELVEKITIEGRAIKTIGKGHGRAVVASTAEGQRLLDQ
ncbi:MAG: hypothetical protein Q9190_007913 [Brigantiaea leucoxantha]